MLPPNHYLLFIHYLSGSECYLVYIGTPLKWSQTNIMLFWKYRYKKILPDWQKQSSWLFTSVTEELNSVLLIKKHLQLVVIVRLKPKTPRLEVWRADIQTSCLVKRMSVYSLCQVYKFFFFRFNHEIFSLRWLFDSILEHTSDHMF